MKTQMAGELDEFWIVMIGDGYMRPVKRTTDPLPACTHHIENAQKYTTLQAASKVVRDLTLAREKLLAVRGGGSLKASARRPVTLLHFVVTIENVSVPRPVIRRPVRLRPLDHLALSTRTISALQRAKIRTVGDLVALAWIDLFCIRGIGRFAIEGIESELARHGLYLSKVSLTRWNPSAERRCPTDKDPLRKGQLS